MSCFPQPSRRERFRYWRERRYERLWRLLHPVEARKQDAANAAMWRRVSPTLSKGTSTLFSPSDQIAIRYKQQFDITPDPSPRRDDWYYDPPIVPQPWYRQLYWRVSGWIWNWIEKL